MCRTHSPSFTTLHLLSSLHPISSYNVVFVPQFCCLSLMLVIIVLALYFSMFLSLNELGPLDKTIDFRIVSFSKQKLARQRLGFLSLRKFGMSLKTC